MKTELLAPAKNKEIAFAAIDCGADAVYIGAGCFGARAGACNPISDIAEVVNYAHKFWAKVFVTVNTILKDGEVDEGYELIKELDKIGCDGVLIQDMGLLKKIIEARNDIKIPIHASTQCDNRTPEKVKFFRDIGLSRVVLARELSLNQIKKIHEEVPDIELEGFIHGALCVSYSGQCYLSHYIGGRSANRGECAQPCRKSYSVLNDNGDTIAKNIYPLCLKDFKAADKISEMINSGIFSFKIEGRLKDEGYVKNIVSYYRMELDKYSDKISSGKSFIKFKPNPEKSFNRGFTDYFLSGRGVCYNFLSPKSQGEYLGKVTEVKKDYFVIKTDKKISSQDGLCFYDNGELTGTLVNKAVVKQNEAQIFPNKKINIKPETDIYRNQDTEFEKELLAKVKRQIGADITVRENRIYITDEDGINVSLIINSKEKANNQQKMNDNFIKQFSKTGDSDFYIKSIKISDVPFMPVSEINKLRRTAFAELMRERIKNYVRQEQKPLKYTKYFEDEIDYRANIINEEAKKFYEKCGCKVKEMGIEFSTPKRQVELMRTKHCIKYALGMCKSPKNLFLKDEMGKIYPLKTDCKKCEMIVLSPEE